MLLSELHTNDKELSTTPLIKGGEGTLISIQLKEGGVLPEHITKVPAVLIAVEGETVYSTEKGEETVITPGMFVNIEPNVKHALKANSDAQLVLMK